MFSQKRHLPDITFKTVWKKIQRCSNVIKKIKGKWYYISCFINFWNQQVMLPHPV